MVRLLEHMVLPAGKSPGLQPLSIKTPDLHCVPWKEIALACRLLLEEGAS